MPPSWKLIPTSFEAAAGALAEASGQGDAVRVIGGGTKLGWGRAVATPGVEVRTARLDQIVEHNAGDLTAVLQAGVPLARAQETFAAAGQMFALDPVAEHGGGQATIGGVIATADSGPLRHRYGSPRDLVVGITVALSDGTIARAGGKVIKNVAGYDLAKLFTGSYGTLGMILSVSLRLHPLPEASATALGTATDRELLATAAGKLSSAPLELDALDVAWRSGRGGVVARISGAEPDRRAERIAALMRDSGLGDVDTVGDDAGLWARQRAGQRSQDAALVRVAARPTALAAVLRAADACGGTLVGRAALGESFIEVDPAAVGRLRELLPPGSRAVQRDGPTYVDPWGAEEGPALELMRRIKQRFDPAGACNPGTFVGGI
jgi:glycolate oxidase FAD binding subunit